MWPDICKNSFGKNLSLSASLWLQLQHFYLLYFLKLVYHTAWIWILMTQILGNPLLSTWMKPEPLYEKRSIIYHFKLSHLAPKKLYCMQRLKSAILAIFQIGPGWPCTVSGALKNPSQDFKNSFCIGCRWISSNARRHHFLKVGSGEITVCPPSAIISFYIIIISKLVHNLLAFLQSLNFDCISCIQKVKKFLQLFRYWESFDLNIPFIETW